MTRVALGSVKGSRLDDFWKYRVGNYRIISIEDGALRILIVKIGNWREVYRNKYQLNDSALLKE